jgi:hypothetical protein
MKRQRKALHFALITVLLASAVVVEAEDAPGQATNVWRASMEAFAKEVISIAKRSKIPDAPSAIKSAREYSVISDEKGEKNWVVFQQGFENEFHGELASRFTGKVSWSGIVDAATTDTAKGVQMIEVIFPTPKDLPRGFEFRKCIRLRIPVAKLPSTGLPKKGDTFAFSGVLKKMKADSVFEPISVLYGLGPNKGKVLISIGLKDPEPIK